MTNLETYFKNSQDIGPYIEQMQDNKDNLVSIYDSFKLPEDDERLQKLIGQRSGVVRAQDLEVSGVFCRAAWPEDDADVA